MLLEYTKRMPLFKFWSPCLGISASDKEPYLIQLVFDAQRPGVIPTFPSSESKAIPHREEPNKTKCLLN